MFKFLPRRLEVCKMSHPYFHSGLYKILSFAAYFYIILQTKWSLNMWIFNQVIFYQEDSLYFYEGKWYSWKFFFAFYII